MRKEVKTELNRQLQNLPKFTNFELYKIESETYARFKTFGKDHNPIESMLCFFCQRDTALENIKSGLIRIKGTKWTNRTRIMICKECLKGKKEDHYNRELMYQGGSNSPTYEGENPHWE